MFCFVYSPPDNSPFYQIKQLKGILVLEDLLLTLQNENVYLVIAGDLNARTAEKRDNIVMKNNVPDLEEYGDILT